MMASMQLILRNYSNIIRNSAPICIRSFHGFRAGGQTGMRLNVSNRTFFITRILKSSSKTSPTTNASQSGQSSKAIPKRSEVRRLFSLAESEKWRLTGAVCLLVVSSSVTLAVPFCIGKVIDIIYTTSKEGHEIMKEKLTQISTILLGVFLVGAVANFGRYYLMQISGQNVVMKMRDMLFSSIMRQEIGFFDKNRTGELINRLSTDTSLVGQSVTMNISDGLRSVGQAVGAVGMMVYVSPKLTAFALLIVPPIAIMSRIYGRYLRKISKNVQDSLAAATQVAEERISNIRTVRAFAQEDMEMERYRDRIIHVLKLSYKEALARGIFWASTGLSGNIVVLSVFYAGGMMMSDSMISVGELSSFLLYAAYVGISIGGMTTFYSEMMKGLGASTRIWELIDRDPKVPYSGRYRIIYFVEKFRVGGHDGGILPEEKIKGIIEFKDLGFSYPSRQEIPIFTSLNLTVPAGSVTAVVGSSGSGKSTIGTLLLRFYDPSSGGIYLDGTNTNKLNTKWLRSHIGTVSQEPILFSCSIAENIAYGSLDPSSATMDMIIEAAKKANAYNFVQAFPEGFHTVVGERGLMLSGGQRQRIAIARALLKDPKILLLDEATSALDAESEYLVQEALERLMVGRTVITIAHRLSTIRSADQIAVLDNGRIAEIGSYNKLMAIEGGLFRKLVERQTVTA